ncbi:mitochondrial substrate carrier family protein X [Acrasis kona]|uniref:Mitochondrial substrate carrier family protein X n=1 Tax=Acrasis kona TaxID=1008807 RepID=A0AAW2YMI4_9EUKA
MGSFKKNLLTGGVAGYVGTCVIYPIDLLKTNVQASKESSVVQVARSLVRHEGIRGLYKGLGSNLAFVVLEKALKLSANDYFRGVLGERHFKTKYWKTGGRDLPAHLSALAGGLTGTVQVVATNPMEIVKIRLQMMQGKGIANPIIMNTAAATTVSSPFILTGGIGAVQVIKSLGIRGLYRGSHITLMRDVPYGLMFFTLYADIKHRLRNKETNVTSFPNILSAGMIAGMVAAALTTPIDCLKTRYQSVEGAKFKNFQQVFTTTVKERGYSGLFRGWKPRAVIIGSLFAIMLLTYEAQKRFITGTEEES